MNIIQKFENTAEKIVKDAVSDLKAEIESLKNRLEKLEHKQQVESEGEDKNNPAFSL